MRKPIYLLVFFGLLVSACGTTNKVSYEPSVGATIECTQVTGDGSCIIQVTESGGSINAATDAALRSAVYSLLFRGIQGSAKDRIQSIPPMVTDNNAINANKDYFNGFFKEGHYRNYAETMAGSVPSVKRTSSGYKVSVVVVLKKEQLRKKLEKDNIIKSLSNVI